ncbi:hypothetical signaling protein [Pelotomaculum thermopropionicum SI]|uniref:Hypothetical signaling protein n=1 Tax=Pelotomaculum thermopropionicum (strain DSM 13744 / JCM 10971 / SI) TaxID=370438 RepID=A5D442_PELTS|nr:hypothetical signaling protein [Pelotomaculum thermopropionicum SI]
MRVHRELNKLLSLIKNYCRDTYRHSVNVSLIASRIAAHLNLSETQVDLIKVAGLLHDVGKIKIEKEIINKPGKLTRDEWNIVKKHPEYGVDILLPHSWAKPFLQWVYCHHERWDGNGYFGIKGYDIPLEARILALADAFDAITSSRPYQKKKNWQESLNEVKRCSGTQFDPFLAQELIQFPDKILKPHALIGDGGAEFGTQQRNRFGEEGADYN